MKKSDRFNSRQFPSFFPFPAFLASLALFFAACSKSNDQPATADGLSITVTDLMGDTTANMAGGAAGFIPMYFSFAANSKVAISDEDKPTLKWDLAFTGPYNAEVYVNSGGYLYNPGYGGPGKGAVIQVDTAFDPVERKGDHIRLTTSHSCSKLTFTRTHPTYQYLPSSPSNL